MKNIKIKLLTLTILLLSISIIYCFADEFAEYPKYFENSNLVPILRNRNFELKEREYSPCYSKERKEIKNEVYYVKDNIYYYYGKISGYNNSFQYDYDNDYKYKPNYARAKSVEQTIKQRVKKEKRKLTNKEKKVLKKVRNYMKSDIEEQDSLYYQDKKEQEEKEMEEEEKRRKQEEYQEIIQGILIALGLFGVIIFAIIIFLREQAKIAKIEEVIKKAEEERQKALQKLQNIDSKDYNAFIDCVEKNKLYDLYGDYIDKEKLAHCYCMAGKYKEAINIYNRLLQTKPNNTEYIFNLALAKYKLNPKDTKDLEQIYNEEKPFVILKEKMNLKFDDSEQQEAMVIKKIRNEIRKPYEIVKIFGTYNRYC